MHPDTEEMRGTSTEEYDGYRRLSGRELLERHRRGTLTQGDIVRTICTLEERLAALERAAPARL